jgi:hypothetical protein
MSFFHPTGCSILANATDTFVNILTSGSLVYVIMSGKSSSKCLLAWFLPAYELLRLGATAPAARPTTSRISHREAQPQWRPGINRITLLNCNTVALITKKSTFFKQSDSGLLLFRDMKLMAEVRFLCIVKHLNIFSCYAADRSRPAEASGLRVHVEQDAG